MPTNFTEKNHFVPCFYTKQWTGSDRRLCQFSRPHKNVVPKRVHPEATGYSKGLYTEEALPTEIKTYLEDVFLKKVDQKACDALQLLLQSRLDDLSDDHKTAWVRFMMSMMQRSPKTIDSLRKRWDEQFLIFGPDLEERYQNERQESDPATLREFLLQTSPEAKARGVVRLLQSVMDLPNLGTHIVNMRWAVLEFRSKKFSLLTSDRPVIRTNGLQQVNAHIGLPISATKLFLCANEASMLRSIADTDTNDIVRQTNRVVITQAEQFVYGADDKALSFVEKNFRKKI